MRTRWWFAAVLWCMALSANAQGDPATLNSTSPQTTPTPLPLIPRTHEDREKRYQAQHRMILNVLVVDASGAPVTGLKPDDFILNDDRAPQKLATFREVNGSAGIAPVHIILLLDAVNNTRGAIADTTREIDKYLDQAQSPLRFPTSLAILTSSGITVGQSSLEKNALLEESRTLFQGVRADTCDTRDNNDPFPRNGVVGPANIGMSVNKRNNGECLNRKFALSVTQLHSLAASQENTLGRVILIWLGAGWPRLSGPEFQKDSPPIRENFFDHIVELSRSMREAQVTLDAVYSPQMLTDVDEHEARTGILTEEVETEQQASAAGLALQVVAKRSGGRVLEGKDIADSIARCVADAETYYAVSFDSPPASQLYQYHSLQVQVNQPGVTVFTTTSYYGEP